MSVQNDQLPVVGVRVGERGTATILLGEPKHQSWCAHNFGQILVCDTRRNRLHTIAVGNCPTTLEFCEMPSDDDEWATSITIGTRTILAVGTSTGGILIANEEAKLLTTNNSIHTHAVTALLWSQKMLLSVSLDGIFSQSQIRKSTGAVVLEPVHTLYITLRDIPRALRKGDTYAGRVGLSSVTSTEEGWLLAGEMGFLWLVPPATKDQQLRALPISHYEPEGIEQIITMGTGHQKINDLILRTSTGGIKHKGSSSADSAQPSPWHSLSDTLPLCVGPIYVHRGSVLLVNCGAELFGVDLSSGGTASLSKSGPHRQVLFMAASATADFFITLDDAFELQLYFLSAEA